MFFVIFGPVFPAKTEIGGQRPPIPISHTKIGMRKSVVELQVLSGHLAVATGNQLERDALAVGEAGNAGALKRADVNECVLRTVFRLNEAETLGRVEPLNGTFGHDFSFHDN